jgi:hypothetical protein
MFSIYYKPSFFTQGEMKNSKGNNKNLTELQLYFHYPQKKTVKINSISNTK